MDFLLNRYRNLTVLLVVIMAQLLLLACQVKEQPGRPADPGLGGHRCHPARTGSRVCARHTIGFARRLLRSHQRPRRQ